MKDLFTLVMEAEGDLLQPFDAGAPEPAENVAPPPPDQSSQPTDQGFDEPPPLAEDDDFQFGNDDGGNDEDVGGDEDNTDDESDKEDGKLSEKANNILNQQLYQKMLDRNDEIEQIINSIQPLVPLLPYEVVKSNDESLNKLKSALSKGQDYVINQFIDAKYGENLLFYQKLDALYVLLMNEIDANLKTVLNKS